MVAVAAIDVAGREAMTGNTGVRITDVAIAGISDEQIEEACYLDMLRGGIPATIPSAGAAGALCRALRSYRLHARRRSAPGLAGCPRRRPPRQPAAAEQRFHTDTCFVERPPPYTSLSAVELPERGGDTVFANQYLAYDRLSPVMKR